MVQAMHTPGRPHTYQYVVPSASQLMCQLSRVYMACIHVTWQVVWLDKMAHLGEQE